MNELALITVGLIFGLVLALVAVLAYSLHASARQQRRDMAETHKGLSLLLTQNTQAVERLRSDVSLALKQVDGDRLHDASVSIQHVSKQLGATVGLLSKAVYASNVGPGLEMPRQPGFTLEEEAEDDARMLAERNRWLNEQGDPLAHMTDERADERANEVAKFFANRNVSGIHSVGSTPPATGAYAAVVQENAQEIPVATLPDFGEAE